MEWFKFALSSVRKRAFSERGGVSPGFLILLPGLLLVSGISIDFTTLNGQRKFVQSQADLAALTAIRNLYSPESVRISARQTIMSEVFHDMSAPLDQEILLGRLSDDYRFISSADQHSLENVSSVQVVAKSPAAMPILGRYLGDPHPRVKRKAIAVAVPRVSFSLSNCMLSLELLDSFVQPLLGVQADVLCSGHGVRVNAVEFFNRLAIRGNLLSPNQTYGDILDAEFQMYDILFEALAAEGFSIGSSPLSNERLRLADFVYMSDDLRRTSITSPIPPLDVNAADIVFGSLELLGSRIVDASLQLDLGPMAQATVKVQISEPRQIVVGARPGDPLAVAETAQIRLALEAARLIDLASVSINIKVATASAKLSIDGEHCSSNPDLRAAVFDPVEADLLDLQTKIALLRVGMLSVLPEITRKVLSPKYVGSEVFTHADVENKDTRNFSVEQPAVISLAMANLSSLLSHVPGLSSALESVFADLAKLKFAEAELSVQDISCSMRLAG